MALTLLVHELHRVNDELGLTIGTFIHDEQQQFGKHLKMAFDVSKRFGNVDATSPLAQIINIKEMTTFDCEFRIASSKTSFGLQILDVVLWLMKRSIEMPDRIHGKSSELVEYVASCGFISQFTQQSMIREVVRGFEILNSGPDLTAEQKEKGYNILAELETSRIERMRATLEPSTPAVMSGPNSHPVSL